jgi:hypothetical protein
VTLRATKKVLASVMVIGAMGSITVSGAYGLMNSETSNPTVKAATGTLTFSNTVGTASACYSYTGAASSGNVNSSCTPIYTSASENYPGTPATVHVTITNNGSLPISDLKLYMPSCTAANTPTSPSPGSADPCGAGGAQFYLQETDASWTPLKCWFPAASGSCALASNSLFVFAQNYKTLSNAPDLGPGPAAGASRYFVIGMQLPSNASNALQGREAVFGLTWHAETS